MSLRAGKQRQASAAVAAESSQLPETASGVPPAEQATTDQAQQDRHSLAGQLLRAAVGTDKSSIDLKSQKRFSKLRSGPSLLLTLKSTARSLGAPSDQHRAADRLGQLIKQADGGLQQQIAATLAEVTSWQPAGERLLWALLTASGPRPRHTVPWLHRIWCIASRSRPLSPQQQDALQRLHSAAEATPERLLLSPVPVTVPVPDTFDLATVTSAMAMRFTAASLAGAMEELGPSCTADEAAFREVAQSFNTVSEKDLAEVLGMMAANAEPLSPDAAEPARRWQPNTVIDVLRASYPGLRWDLVPAALDYEGFQVPDKGGAALLLGAWQRASGKPFPGQALVGGVWNNGQGQLSLLRHAVSAPPHLVTWDGTQRLEPIEGLPPAQPAQAAWHSLAVLDTLGQLAQRGHAPEVLQLLEAPCASCPEAILVGLADIPPLRWGPLQDQVLVPLMDAYLRPHPNSAAVVRRLFQRNQAVPVRAMEAVCQREPAMVHYVCTAVQELQDVNGFLEACPLPFSIEIAAALAARKLLNLETWLLELLQTHQDAAVQALVDFTDQHVSTSEQGQPPHSPIPLACLAACLTILASEGLSLSPGLAPQVLELQHRAAAVHPVLSSTLQNGSAEEAFPSDVEAESNERFQRAFTGQEAPELLLDALAALKASEDPRERQVSACMIHNLFDEYRFFAKYPDKELSITAVLFGGLIQRGLVADRWLDLALRYLLEALRSPPGSKLCTFARSSLLHCRAALRTWPTYCSLLLQVPYFSEAEPELASELKELLHSFADGQPGQGLPAAPAQGSEPEHLPPLRNEDAVSIAPLRRSPSPPGPDELSPRNSGLQGTALPGPVPPLTLPDEPPRHAPAATQPPVNTNRAFNIHNMETLEAALQLADVQPPPQNVVDRVSFIMNNLTSANLSAKVPELRDLLPAEQWPWFCNYLVVRRAAQETNHHETYVRLVDALGDASLGKMALSTTYKYIRTLLVSPHLKTKSGERSLLRNLGSWLGRLTLARQQPIRQRDLDLKQIMYEAYEQGKMIAVMPFLVKVMEPCKGSDRIFTSRNPWVVAILALAAEIYTADAIKLNLKFDVEMLFRHFSIKVNDIKATDTLKCHTRTATENPDFHADRAAPGAGRTASPAPSHDTAPSPAAAAAQAQPASQDGSQTQTPPAPTWQGPQSSSAVAIPAGPPAQPPAGSVGSPPGREAPAGPPSGGGTADQGLFASVHNSCIINPSLLGVSERLSLAKVVPSAVDRAISEIILPTVERSVTIGRMTTLELVNKDFALEADEGQMRAGAHLIAGSLSGSLALATGKEPLRSALTTQLRAMLHNRLPGPELEAAIATIVADNLDLGCGVIEKTAMDKAVREIDHHLMGGYEARRRALQCGQQYVDAAVIQRMPGQLPEQLRPRLGRLTPAQMRVYEDFARLPNTLAPASTSQPGGQRDAKGLADGLPKEDALSHLGARLQAWISAVDTAVAKDPAAPLHTVMPEGGELGLAVAEVSSLLGDRQDLAMPILQRILQRMLEVSGFRLHTNAMAQALRVVVDAGSGRGWSLGPQVTSLWLAAQQIGQEPQLSRWDVAAALLRRGLLSLQDIDGHVSAVLQQQRSQAVLDFALRMVRALVLVEQVATPPDLASVLGALGASAQAGAAASETLQQLASLASQPPQQARPPANWESMHPPGLRETVHQLLEEWLDLQQDNPVDNRQQGFVTRLHSAGLLKGNELTDRFLHSLLELSVQHCLASGEQEEQRYPGTQPPLNFMVVDAFVRLLATLVTAHGGGPALLARAMGLWASSLQRSAQVRALTFSSRPYYRIMLGCIQELGPKPGQEQTGVANLATLAQVLLEVQPLRVPSFTFAWLELVSHRNMMPKLLMADGMATWPPFLRLIVALLQFLEPYLRELRLTDAIRMLYKGTLRVLLVLLHDLPEFLCEFHFELVSHVPTSCVQMRNLILSAFPRTMRLPDPFTPNLKVDLLLEINQQPMFQPPTGQQLPQAMANEVQEWVNTRRPANFLASLATRFLLPPADAVLTSQRYNIPLLNSFVFYVGLTAIRAKNYSGPPTLNDRSPQMEIFSQFMLDLDAEGRYLVINAAANQLRYPNSHTHYFSWTLLLLFHQAKREVVQEQITRVLLERLIVNRPHPWGLLITFIELLKNPRYEFWTRGFTRCAAEIERLFDSVASSCMNAGRPDEGGVPAADTNAPRQA